MFRKVSCCYLTNTGGKKRENQDGLLLNDILVSQKDMAEPRYNEFTREKHLYLVVDGLGGHNNGSLACQTVLETFRQEYEQIRDETSILKVLAQCRERLNQRVLENSQLAGLGVTMAGMMLEGSGAMVFSCGDCRVYRCSEPEKLERLTKDHSLVQGLADKGLIADEQIRLHPGRNIVTSGIIGDLKDDAFETSIIEIALHSGDRFLVCTDGTWENFDTVELQKLLFLNPIAYSASLLARETSKRGAEDNFSFLLFDFI